MAAYFARPRSCSAAGSMGTAQGKARAVENPATSDTPWAYRRDMEVTFTKVDDKRYTIAIEREHGPALVARSGPGYDDLMPHDLAHYLVEEYFGIELGVWGQLAAGGGGIFSPAPEDNTLRHQRRVRRIAAVGREMQSPPRSGLVAMVVTAWERSIKRVKHPTTEARDRGRRRGAARRRPAHGRGGRALARARWRSAR